MRSLFYHRPDQGNSYVEVVIDHLCNEFTITTFGG